MQKVVCYMVLIIAAMSNVASAQSAIGDETKIAITSMAVSGDNIFAGTKTNGVYRSADGGKSWSPVNSGLPDRVRIKEMAASGKNVFTIAYVVYSATPVLYVSGDNGMNWKEVSVFPTNRIVTNVASFKNKLFAATPGGLYESSDGEHWDQVKAVTEEKMTSVFASGNCVLAWHHKDRSENIFYSSTDGKEWNKLKDQRVWPDDLEVHGNNFVAAMCDYNKLIANRTTCVGNILWVLDKKAKNWEQVDFKARYFGFDGDKIYAVKVKVYENRKKEAVYEREIVVSDDKGRSWEVVDEYTDPFVTTDHDMQEKLRELEMFKPAEIGEITDYRAWIVKNRKIRDSLIDVHIKEQKKMEYKMYNGTSSNKGPAQPDYRALSQDRYNARHNTSSYIDSKGGIHIR